VVAAIGFAAVIAGVPATQAVWQMRRGEWPQAVDVLCRAPTAENRRAYQADLEEASVVAGRLRPWVQYAQFSLLRDAGAKAVVGRDGWLFYRPGLEYLTGRPPPDPGRADADPLPAILSFRNQLAARGIHLVLMPAPNKESIYPDRLSGRAGPAQVAVARQTRQLLERLRAAGVEVVDLFDVFRQAKHKQAAAPARALYLAQDTHWSPAGVALAAKAAAERLLARGWVQPGPVPYDARPAPVRRVGDVVRMLQSPPIERLVGAEDIRCEQVFRRDTQTPYQDAADADILVLGDSFLQIYEQDEPGSAGLAAHLARLLGQPVTSLISDGGGATLGRQELHRRPGLLAKKRVVLWEFVERDIRFAAEGWQVVPLPDAGPPG
jgi:hypothetical protein